MRGVLKLFFSLIAFACFISCGSCGGEMPPPVPEFPVAKKGDTVSRTLIVYAMAENSLSNYVSLDLAEIFEASTDIPDDCRLFAFVDESNAGYPPYICQFYNKGGVPGMDTVYVYDYDFCSSDPHSLASSLDLILSDYPTETLDIVMWSHGDGWLRHNSKSAPDRSIGIDNGKNSYSNTSTDVIEMEELAEVLENLPVKVDKLMFDACFMQTVEGAYALRDAAEWIIASPAEIPGDGAPYDKLVPLFFSPTATVGDIINEYKVAYDGSNTGVVLSAVKAGNMQLLADATYRHVKSCFDRDSLLSVDNIFSYLRNGNSSYPGFYDINAVMARFLDEADYVVWKRALDAAIPYLNFSPRWYTAVLYGYINVDYATCSGMSMYLPMDKSSKARFNADFATTEWYSAAGWNETGW